MIEGIGRKVGEGIVTMIVLAFFCGMAALAACWALWHFVLSHVRIAWVP